MAHRERLTLIPHRVETAEPVDLLGDIGPPIAAELLFDITGNPIVADRGGVGAARKCRALCRHRIAGTGHQSHASGQASKCRQTQGSGRRPGVSAFGKGGVGLAVCRHGNIPGMVGGRMPGLCLTNLIVP